MLLSITTTHQPATDLGYLLHKHPDNVRTVSFPFGEAHVFFPEASDERCTATLLIEIDPIGLVRRKGKSNDSFALASYVNDRPFAASSFTSVVLAKVFGTAMTGRCESRPELAESPIPVAIEIPVLPCTGGGAILRRCFEPLGYEVECAPIELDERFPDWGDSRYLQVTLRADVRVADLLSHLYVLMPVLDNDKHYWVGEDEVDKLLAKGEPWLGTHPDREMIVRRYLRHRRPLTATALSRLIDEDSPEP
jgi:3' terminal RNA ribose 2'-O-methyltransferase Hen1